MSGLADPRFRHLVGRLHACGPRAVAELLAEIGAAHMIRTSIETRLERFARLDPEVLRAIGADRFPTNPLHLVQGDNKP